MRKLNLRILGMAILTAAVAHSQQAGAQARAGCGTDEYQQQIIKAHPEVLQIQQAMDKAARTMSRSTEDDGRVVTIPVVFHIIHDDGAEKVSRQACINQINMLNTCYRLRNKDTAAVRPMFKHLETDTRIEFVLASQDPWGNCSDGVSYVRSSLTANANDNVKSLEWWDNKHYLNVWVVRSITQSAGQKGTIVGYAQFPWDADIRSATDGIILEYAQLLSVNGQKTLVHEIGHYFGLMHPFQDGCSEDQLLQGDKVEDTPPVDSASFGWNPNANTCHSDVPDLPDMIENYMDYSDKKLLFTQGQVARMRSYLFSSARNGLWAAPNLAKVTRICATGISEASEQAPDVNIYPNPAGSHISITITTGSNVALRMEVYDIAGRLLYSKSGISISQGTDTLGFETASLNMNKSGVYLLKVSCGSMSTLKKVILSE